MNEPDWVDPLVVEIVHTDLIREFGGNHGVRDKGLLESALHKPLNVFQYNPDATIFELAASYAYGIAKNHPFVDGNKRSAFVTATIFLEINGQIFCATEIEATRIFLALAEGKLSEDELRQRFEKNCT